MISLNIVKNQLKRDRKMTDFRKTKIHIKSEEHSKAFQEAVFEAGGKWCDSGEFYLRDVDFIFVNDSLSMSLCGNAIFFQDHDYREIQFPTPIKVHIQAEPTSEDGGRKVNIHELTNHGLTRQYTHKAKGGVYAVVAIAKAAGDIRSGGYGSIIVYKNEHGDLFSRSLRSFKDFMSPIDLEVNE